MRRQFAAACGTVSLLAAIPFGAFAQPVIAPYDSLSGDDPDGTPNAFGDAYGVGLATWADWLFVGTPRETAFRDGVDQMDGAVYVYRKGGGSYVFQQKLTMPGSAAQGNGDRFGAGVETEGGWLFVGASNDQDFPGLVDPRQVPGAPAFEFAGQVHVYRLNASIWEYAQTLISPTPGSSGSYGAQSQVSHIALSSDARVAVIGEPGIGQLHSYRLIDGTWRYVQTINQPFPALIGFGKSLVFASERYLVVGAQVSQGRVVKGQLIVYRVLGASGRLAAVPVQVIAGSLVLSSRCEAFGAAGLTYGAAGLDAAAGLVVVAEPCASGAAGAFAGRVDVYRVGDASPPLSLQAMIEGDEAGLFFGQNIWGSSNALAISKSGRRILVGSPVAAYGAGADVRVYAFDDALGWTEESNLTSTTETESRYFGDTMIFADGDTAFVRENNVLDPLAHGAKGRGMFYDLTP